MNIDTTYKKLNIDSEYAKPKDNHHLVVFDDLNQAQQFGEFIEARSIMECTDGFLLNYCGSLVTTLAWYEMLLEAKKRFNLQYRLV